MLGKRSWFEDPEIAWAGRVLAWYKESRPFDSARLIWAVTTGDLDGPVGGRMLSEYFNCPLVLEIQDPVPFPGGNPLTREQQRSWEQCLRRSNQVITTTSSLAAQLRNEYGFLDVNRTKTLYLTYDDSVPLPQRSPRRGVALRLLHAGYLHGGLGRSASHLIEAIALAGTKEPALRGQLSLRLLGAGPGGKEALAHARHLGVGECVEALPQVSQAECLHEMDAADVLVVIKFPDSAFDMQVPGKVFQYLGRGKPVLGIMGENTEAAAILRQSGLAEITKHNNTYQLTEIIVKYWANKDKLDEIYHPDWKYIHQFSRSHFGAQVSTLLDNALESF
jgi:hypothetical protein